MPCRRPRALATLAALVLLAACERDLTDPGGGALVTDGNAYVARYEGGSGSYARYGFTVVARFTNTTARTLYLERCYPNDRGPIYGVRLVGGTDSFGSAYGVFWACVGIDLAAEIAVPPGTTRVDTLHIVGPAGVDGYTQQPLGVFEGRMRLVYQVLREDGPARDIGLSNAFDVRRE